MVTGYKRTLEPPDLYTLTDEMRVENMANKFYHYFSAHRDKAVTKHIAKKCKQRHETPSTLLTSTEEDLEDFEIPKWVVVWALFATFKWQYSIGAACLVLANSGQTLLPLVSKKLIQFVSARAAGEEVSIGKGIGYSFCAAAMVMIVGILVNHYFYRAQLTGAEAKLVLTKALLDKSFRLSDESRHDYPSGKITAMMGADLSRIDFALGFQPFILAMPVLLAIAIVILVINVGPVSLLGVGSLVIFMVIVAFVALKLFALRRESTVFTDKRVSAVKEALANLKVLKFYSWEPAYLEGISEVRRLEMRVIRRMQVLRNLITAFAMSFSLFSSMLTFLVLYAVNSNDRNPASIFSSLSLFGVLSQLTIMLPMALSSGADALLGALRIAKFLDASEKNETLMSLSASPQKQIEMERGNLAIDISDASFDWPVFEDEPEDAEDSNPKKSKKITAKSKDASNAQKNLDVVKQSSAASRLFSDSSSSEEKKLDVLSETGPSKDRFFNLSHVDLQVRKNEFVVVTGLIGSGKSSLLAAMLGFMNRTAGTVDVNGSLLLCGYPWVQNATAKENIVFGSEFDEKKYASIVYACSLESDFDVLPGGDQTEIGERGITLSGGQKARINLARAVYADRDIILLDDVLSAVDARVGKHIMNECILGLLKHKTRILATHQLSLIGAADRIVFINADHSIEVGTFDELKARNSEFGNLMQYNTESENKDELENDADDDVEMEEADMIERQLTKKSTHKLILDEEAQHKKFNENNTDNGVLTQEEERAENAIGWDVYKNYLKIGSGKAGPFVTVPIFIFMLACSTFCQLFTNTWLSFWTELKFEGRANSFYIGIYIMFTFMSLIVLLVTFIILVYLTNTAAVGLNIMATTKILHTPMSFMDVTPMGRILNRFTKDTDVLDNEIGDQMRFLLYILSNIIGVLILCIIYMPWFAIAVPFLGMIFVSVADFYQGSAREIKRLEAIQRSFVYNNFNEVLGGISTIQAYNAQSRFSQKSDNFIDNMGEAYYLTLANQRWVSIHMDMIACVFALLISLLCVNRIFKISPASVGLLLSYVFQIAGQLLMLVKTYTQVENEMNSAERLSSYAFHLPEEAPAVIENTAPPPEWPQAGSIRFENASLAYRPGLPLVLKHLSFDIKGSEKIGICGRTGAGKSSIMTALYRLSELESGNIEIDGIDIATIGLRQLRSKLSIIPQDPVLFKGTIRKNLDPFSQSSDAKLWDSLRRTGLIEGAELEKAKNSNTASEAAGDGDLHKFHLDQVVEDDGSNFSLGEKQLIAFARALVRESKILILDEATSSVDYETDAKIQSTIIREFSDCTILCIAHRLKTIINYDRILVLDKGELCELDTPEALFQLANGIFRQMCDRLNIVQADFDKLDKFS